MINFYISAFLADLALGAVLLSLPLLLIYKFGANSLLLGLFGALGAFVYTVGAITTGRFSDRLDRRKIIISGCFLFILVYSFMPFLNHLGQVFFIYVFGALSMSMFWPTIQSWLSQGLNKGKLIRSLTNFNICWSAGLTMGFLFAGFLFSFDIRAPFLLGICLIAVVILLLWRQPVPSEMMDEPAKKVFLETEKERPEDARRFLYIAWCANFVSWYIAGTVRNLFPKLGTELGFSIRLIGILIFFMMLAQTIMFFILGRTHKWHYRLYPILLFQAFAIISLVMLAVFSNTLYFIAAMVFLGLSTGITYFSSLLYSLYGFIDKGKKSGIHEAFIGAGTFLGPLIGGFSAHNLGIRSPYLVAALLLGVAIIVEIILRKKVLRHT
jgi:DHA1 family multidrug resistance protein-like MFS transporter